MLSKIKAEFFSLIIENATPESKTMFLNKSILEQSIINDNISLTNYLLNANIYSENALLLAVQSNKIDFVEIILKYHKMPHFINGLSENGTPLHIAVENKNLAIVKKLLSIPGINPNLYNKKQQTPLIIAISNINLEISIEILNFYDKKDQTQMIQFNKSFEVLLMFLFDEFRKTLSDFLIPPRKEELISDYKNQTDLFPILMKILEYRAVDPNILINNWTILLYACKNDEIDLVNVLLCNEKTDVNLCSPIDGSSPLMVSIQYNHFKIAKILIENPKTNLNIRNFKGDTALTISASKQFENIVDLLINNEKFDPGESCIDKAFYNSSINISKLLSSMKSLDVNYLFINDFENTNEEKSFITTLMNSVITNDIEKIDLIINHPSFDKTKSHLIRSIFLAVKIGTLEIFIKLISVINNDVNIHNSNHDFLLNFAIENYRIDIAKYILENPSLDPNKCDILSAFTFYVKNITQESIDMMHLIYNYDKEHHQIINFNQLLPSGKSFFTLIAPQQHDVNDSSFEGKIATFFIEHGVDPNQPDKKGFYPLEYAILMKSTDLVRALINSNKIDFSQFVEVKSNSVNFDQNPPEGCLKASKAKKKTFLHIAARLKNPDILKILVERNAIDINSTDELGETPLFEACRYKQINNIKYLATLNTVDYNHCNNEGDDILTIMKKNLNMNYDFEITDKDDYFVALMSIFNTNENNNFFYINYYHLD